MAVAEEALRDLNGIGGKPAAAGSQLSIEYGIGLRIC
jgi:hypothetical protein